MRVGIGYDIHRLMEGKPLILGGVEIPYIKGLVGYSDADVLLHAVSDAILGAASMGDIGMHFPDTDPRYKGASSASLLRKVIDLISRKGYRVNNVDIVVIAEEPKIGVFRAKISKKISDVLHIDESRISVKATTSEGVGSIGRGEAIASYAVVTLEG
ncbi:MAG: 2-C-methyl-D-erythritol 2,4-cyclodiphosphate synthase [Candidatus Omnitrophota bacterium]|nr:MAG: 2-C-methyl-D-erythritol 2,4-cyclodiphosphate synthase [Candidatus Omnitrophota bacterium]